MHDQQKKKFDTEFIMMGAEMAVYHIEAGVRNFPDFVEKMVADLGDDVRPYLKMFYNAARDYPGMEELRKEMTPYDEVEATDVFSICQNEEMKEEPDNNFATKKDMNSNVALDVFNSKLESFTIGEPFPWKEYAIKNVETIRPVLNMEGFDVVISLANISEQETDAFCHQNAILSVKNITGIPFMVLDFAGILRVDFTLNIMKMRAEYRDMWINMKDPNYSIRVFLIEATTTNLVAIRYCPFDDMSYIRHICAPQLDMKKEEIDSLIGMHQQMYDINTLVQKANKQYVFDVIGL